MADIEVCDNCLNVAYDNGMQGYMEQAEAMIQLGLELEDHLCEETESQGEIRCECSCHPQNGW